MRAGLPFEQLGSLVECVRQARGSKHDDILCARCLRCGEHRQRNRDDGRAKFDGGPHRLFSGPQSRSISTPKVSFNASSRSLRPVLFFNTPPAFAGKIQALTFRLAPSAIRRKGEGPLIDVSVDGRIGIS
jgi:hypothetical protein